VLNQTSNVNVCDVHMIVSPTYEKSRKEKENNYV